MQTTRNRVRTRQVGWKRRLSLWPLIRPGTPSPATCGAAKQAVRVDFRWNPPLSSLSPLSEIYNYYKGTALIN